MSSRRGAKGSQPRTGSGDRSQSRAGSGDRSQSRAGSGDRSQSRAGSGDRSQTLPATGAKRPSRPRREMPAGAEALRAERKAAREAKPDLFAAEPAPGEALPGGGVVRSAVVGTIVFAVVSLLAVVVPSTRIAVVAVDLALFLAGCGLYFWGWAVAASRSRESQISLLNLILLQDVAPNAVRVRLLGALGVQIAVAAATCWITAALAFGWLVPVWGLAHCEYWGARYGVFGPRDQAGMGRQDRR